MILEELSSHDPSTGHLKLQCWDSNGFLKIPFLHYFSGTTVEPLIRPLLSGNQRISFQACSGNNRVSMGHCPTNKLCLAHKISGASYVVLDTREITDVVPVSIQQDNGHRVTVECFVSCCDPFPTLYVLIMIMWHFMHWIVFLTTELFSRFNDPEPSLSCLMSIFPINMFYCVAGELHRPCADADLLPNLRFFHSKVIDSL